MCFFEPLGLPLGVAGFAILAMFKTENGVGLCEKSVNGNLPIECVQCFEMLIIFLQIFSSLFSRSVVLIGF